MKETELIFIPVPSTGHLLVHIEFAKRLISLDHRIHTITILNLSSPSSPHASVFARSLIASQPKIRLHDLPSLQDPPPFDLYQRAPEAYIVQLIKKNTPLIKDAVSSIISSRRRSESVRVAGLILDLFCNSLIKDVGNELNLPSYIYLTCNARYLGMMKYIPDRHRKIASEFDLSSGDEELTVPGFVNTIPAKFLPSGLFNREAYEAYVELAPRFADAKGILVNSFSELEPHPFDYFSQQKSFPPVYPVGPILSLKDRASPKEESVDRDTIVRWLEDQPESSVVFLCFGSRGSVDEPQVKEIARALELVGCRFLWSIRTSGAVEKNPEDVLPEGFMGRVAGQGLVCGWAPQVEVLAHKAIGGFVSHCGWNSTLESLWFGVPVATWPMYAEQQLNSFTLVKELGLAVDLRMDYVSGRGDLVTCDEITRALRSLMDGGDEKRIKVKEMADAARKTLMDGGSSYLATARFIGELLDDGSC